MNYISLDKTARCVRTLSGGCVDSLFFVRSVPWLCVCCTIPLSSSVALRLWHYPHPQSCPVYTMPTWGTLESPRARIIVRLFSKQPTALKRDCSQNNLPQHTRDQQRYHAPAAGQPAYELSPSRWTPSQATSFPCFRSTTTTLSSSPAKLVEMLIALKSIIPPLPTRMQRQQFRVYQPI